MDEIELSIDNRLHQYSHSSMDGTTPRVVCNTIDQAAFREFFFIFFSFRCASISSLVIILTYPRAYEHQISDWPSLAPARRRWSSIRSSRIWAKYCAHSFWMAFPEPATAASPWVPSWLEGALVRRAGTGGCHCGRLGIVNLVPILRASTSQSLKIALPVAAAAASLGFQNPLDAVLSKNWNLLCIGIMGFSPSSARWNMLDHPLSNNY